jgi:CheY-like chemotaxis protein
LPIAIREIQQSGESPHDEREEPSPSGYRLLVVDDNEDAATSLAMLLRLKGHDVMVAHDGPSALEIASDYRPNLVFLDLGMPQMDGFEVARRLKRMSELENTLVVAVTGWGQEEDRRRTAEAGFHRHLVKPPEPKALENVLAELKQRHT